MIHARIARLAGALPRAAQRYLAEFIAKGVDGMTMVRRYGRPSELMDHVDALHDHFLSNPPATVARARPDIERLNGIRRGLTQARLYSEATSV